MTTETKWATCDVCNQVMTPGTGCVNLMYGIGNKRFARIPCHTATCGDCNVKRGQLHHPGCDNEACPTCGGQAIGCDCPYDGDEDED
jgi:hypothetical protein